MVTSVMQQLASKSLAIVIWLTLLSCLSITSTAFGQQKPISIEASNMQPSVVLGRPILTWWDVKIPGAGLLTGKLRFQVHSEGYQFASLETEVLTLNGPEQRIRVLLPAIDSPQPVDRLLVDISFEGDKYSGDLGQQILRVPFAMKCVFNILVGESRIARKRTPEREKLMERLKFESLVPMPVNSTGQVEEPDGVQTIFASVDPVDFPAEPISYCNYDLVLLMREEFRHLRKAQLEGLLAWVRAGGSLYLEPNGVLEPYHLQFLQDLIRDDSKGLVFLPDSRGKIPQDTVPPDQVAISLKSGLGNVVIRTEDPERPITLSIEDWRKIAGPLWKWRSEPHHQLLVMEHVVGLDGQPTQVVRPNPDPWNFSLGMLNRHPLHTFELLDRLLPDGVRMVPLPLLALILTTFILIIGPGDYYVLGWLKARKFTWLTFPVTTLAVTALTVLISNSYMSTSEARRALVVHDIGPRNDIVRTNRFELLFVASTHQVTTEVEKGLLTPLKTNSSMNDIAGIPPGFVYTSINGQMTLVPSGGGISGSVTAERLTSQFQGRIPTQSSTVQNLSKWTPQINRIMSLSQLATAPDVDWSQFDLKKSDAVRILAHEVPGELLARVHETFGKDALVACFTGHGGWASDRAPGWRSTRESDAPAQRQFYSMQASGYDDYNQRIQMINEADLFRWMYYASVAPVQRGAFSLVKQTAPKGGAYCDDLALMDCTDPDEWILVVIVPHQDEYVTYRKLMRFQESSINRE
ncbi:hypothetical protein [Schlesneria sp. T3-172]|uniref:hypothetical protein n=1 Tax=Schlesneria sphaerica TaxID=3373610 RepID=UPI0037CB57FE